MRRGLPPAAEAAIAAALMCAFALCLSWRSQTTPVAAIFLLGVGLLARRAVLAEGAAAASAMTRPRRIAWHLALVAVPVGAGLGVLARLSEGLGALPGGLGTFAPVAVLIGVAEELVYRGYVQGRLRACGVPAAICLTALAHAAYKCALFAFQTETRLLLLGAITFVVGSLFGWLRERAGHVAPAAVAHAAFDLVVYGGLATAPWWVWR